MTVQVLDGLVVLAGTCGVEEAEPLLAALLDDKDRHVAIDTVHVHTALWQVLLALRPRIERTPDDRFVVRHILPVLLDGVEPHADQTASRRRPRKAKAQDRTEQNL